MINLPPLALSVRQPWAWAIIHAGKDIENRSWQAVNLGTMEPKPVCIHASKGMTQAEYEAAKQFMAELGVDCPSASELVRGAIIGTVTITSIVNKHSSPWYMGPRGLVLEDPITIEPIACKGALGFFNWREKWQQGGEVDQAKPWMLKKKERSLI